MDRSAKRSESRRSSQLESPGSCGTVTVACAEVSYLRKQAPAGVPVPHEFGSFPFQHAMWLRKTRSRRFSCPCLGLAKYLAAISRACQTPNGCRQIGSRSLLLPSCCDESSRQNLCHHARTRPPVADPGPY